MSRESQGIMALLLAATSYSFLGVFSRLIGFDLPVFYQQVVRYFFSLVILIPILLYSKSWKSIRKQDYKWILVRAGCGLISFLGIYISFLYVSFSTVYFISYATATIGGYFLGRVLFKEQLKVVQIISLIIALIGLYFVYPKSLDYQGGRFVIILVIAGFATSGWNTLSKKITKEYSNLQTIILDYAIGVFALLVISLLMHEVWVVPSFDSSWIYLGLLLIVQIITNFLIVYGFQRVKPSLGSLILLFDIIIGVMLGYLFFQESPEQSVIFGGSLIIFAITLPYIQNRYKKI